MPQKSLVKILFLGWKCSPVSTLLTSGVTVWIRFGARDPLLACASGSVALPSSNPSPSILNRNLPIQTMTRRTPSRWIRLWHAGCSLTEQGVKNRERMEVKENEKDHFTTVQLVTVRYAVLGRACSGS